MSLSLWSALVGKLEEEVFEVNDPDTDDPPPPLHAEIKNKIKNNINICRVIDPIK